MAGAPGEGGGRHRAPRLEALDAPRWLASIQIMLSHFYTDDHFQHRASLLGPPNRGEWWHEFARYGRNWTQFFFLLSGFVLAYVEMTRPLQKAAPMSLLSYVRRRLITIYPAYLFALFTWFLLVIQFDGGDMVGSFQWKTLLPSTLLMQSWVVVCSDHNNSAWSWNTPAWFLSALVVYWCLVRQVASFFRGRGFASSYFCLFGLWAFSLVPGFVAELFQPWDNCMNINIMAGSVGYFHVFIAGIVSARIFILTCFKDAQTDSAVTTDTECLALDPERAPLAFRYGCSVGYLLYFVYFVCVDMQALPFFFHNGGVMPIMLLIIVGASIGTDPIAKYIFQTRLFRTLGELSYAQYLMQAPLYMFFQVVTGTSKGEKLPLPAQTLYPLALIAVGYVVQNLVQTPYAEWLRWRQEKGIVGVDEQAIARIDGMLDRCWQRCREQRTKKSLGTTENFDGQDNQLRSTGV